MTWLQIIVLAIVQGADGIPADLEFRPPHPCTDIF